MNSTVLLDQGYLFNPHTLGLALAALALMVLGLTTLWHDRHSRHTQLFFWFSLALADYFACFACASSSTDAKTALLWVRLAYIGVPLVPVMLFSFVESLRDRTPGARILLFLGWALAISFVLAAQTTNLLIAGVERQGWGYYKQYGVLGIPFLAYVLGYGALCGIFYRRLLQATQPGSRGRSRLTLHVRALLVGSLIAVDFVAGFGWPVYPFGYLPTVALVVILLLAMRRYGPVFFTPVLAADKVLATMGEAFFVVDEDGVIRDTNPAAEKLLKRTRQEIMGQPFARLLPVAPFQNGVLELFPSGSPSVIAAESTDEAGRTTFLSITGSCLANSLGAPLAVLCIVRDVTTERQAQLDLRLANEQLEQKVQERTRELLAENQQRQRTEALLRKSEEKYRLLVENAQEGILVLQDQRVKFINPYARSVIGFNLDELVAKPFLEFIHPDDRLMVANYHRGRVAGEAQEQGYSIRIIDKAGQIRWLEVIGTYIEWEGRPATLNFASDITNRKLAEKEREKLEVRLRHAQKMEAMGTLVGGIAHEFNNLLGMVVGYAELARDLGEQREDNTGEIDQIIVATDRATALVRQMLTFSRKARSDKMPLSLNDSVTHASKMLERTLPRNISIETSLALNLPLVEGDSSQIEQILINLATNARDAMPQGGKLSISTKLVAVTDVVCDVCGLTFSGARVLLTVSDTGEGIAHHIMSQIFEPFFTTKEVGKGTGLGLSVVMGLVQDHGGHIQCESTPGLSTTFSIYLPVQ